MAKTRLHQFIWSWLLVSRKRRARSSTNPRQACETPLYRLFERYYEDVKALWEERFERTYGFWRGFVDKVVFRYLDCGILERGFARVSCPDCHEEFLLPFSCKCRGFCPSCGAKRAAAFAAFLEDELLEDVAHAQWVFTLPKMLRRYFLYNRELLGLLSWKHSGFSIDNSVTVYPSDEQGLERLARYLIRSPVSRQRLCPVDPFETMTMKRPNQRRTSNFLIMHLRCVLCGSFYHQG